jgi:hypothetical protein
LLQNDDEMLCNPKNPKQKRILYLFLSVIVLEYLQCCNSDL